MRRHILSTLLLLAGCDSAETASERAQAARTSPDGIECALAGADRFERQCRLERDGDRGLTIHHPDGGFRRLAAVGSGPFAPADGADRGSMTNLPDGRTLWVVDRDRYRLPAR